MASRFQSRLVGTILVVAVGVILLPDFLDGQKKSYHDEFEVIPLKPAPAPAPQIKQPQDMADLAGVKPANSEDDKASGDSTLEDNSSLEDNSTLEGKDAASQTAAMDDKAVKSETKSDPQADSDKAEQAAPEKVATAKPTPEPSKPEAAKPEAVKPEPSPEAAKPQFKDNAWTIQLVALRNKENADKLAADLKKRGYLVNVNVQGGVSRVIIGPDLSRDKMLKQIGELEKITGLKGQLRQFKTFQQ